MIGPFRLTIHLEVISGADILLDAYFSTDVLGELRCQLWILVRNDLSWDSIMWEDLSKVEFGQFFSSHGFLAEDEYHCLGTVVVGNSKNGIIS